MKWSTAVRVSLDTNLAQFLHVLQQQGIGHRVTEDSGEQVLWVASDAQAEQVRELYQQFQAGQWPTDDFVQAVQPKVISYQRLGFVDQLRRSPVTTAVLLACLAVDVINFLG